VVRILANPVLLRAAVVLMCAGTAFLVGLLSMRLLRKKITEEGDLTSNASPSLETLPLHLYNTVIQQLKQQKHELLVQSQAEQQRARTSESFSQAVLSNLSCGVLVFGANALVKTSNAAAKAILGFASTTGMSAEDIFRGALAQEPKSKITAGAGLDEAVGVADEIQRVMRKESKQRQVETEYETPRGEKRYIQITISPVPATDGELLGVTCLINDRTELESIRQQQALQGELSAEMALQLRTSLTTISGYAQQLANNRDAELAQQLASDIAQEAAHLDRSLGGFLITSPSAKAAAASNKE
jgi:nitrogen fixation/metabolism regulation signal transduction histidine kinase